MCDREARTLDHAIIEAAGPGCSAWLSRPGALNNGADTTLALVSRVPLECIEQFRTRMGWTLPWYSSDGSEFNYDFHVSSDEATAPIEYNCKDKETLERENLAF